MTLNLRKFIEACRPTKTLDMENIEDRGYYIDFAGVRGDRVINKLKRTITHLYPDKPTCQLFTGHIGCGKSTELSWLQNELKQERFRVVYFQATDDLDVEDVDITDILLAIAHQVTESLVKEKINLPTRGLKAFLKEVWEFLNTPIEITEIETSLPNGIAKITATIKDSQHLRSRLRQRLEPETMKLLNIINEEIFKVATEQLKEHYKGLVIIVDNLDRIQNKTTAVSSNPLPEYLFVDRGEQLSQISCHLVYTLPLSLIFSNQREVLKSRMGKGASPMVLPMIPVQYRDGREHTEGMALLRQMVLARAFPDVTSNERLNLVTEVFDSMKTLDRLCSVTGGHVRNLLGMLYSCLQEDDPPISHRILEKVIRIERDALALAIDQDEWDLLFQVVKQQTVKGDKEFQTLLQSLFVFEYQDEQGKWFGLNPLLFETEKYKLWKQQNQDKRI
ncbi:MAG: ATP-binding protein [Nostoc sp. GBBB01]|nr:ATP-binding protein [Nostoc sp. GBBB01]